MPDSDTRTTPPASAHAVPGALRSNDPAAELRPRPEFLGFKVVEKSGPGGVGTHRHVDYEAIYVHSGAYSCVVNQTRMELPPGEGILIKPGDQHQDIFPGPDAVCYLAIRFRLRPPATGDTCQIFHERATARQQRFDLPIDDVWPICDAVQRESAGSDIVTTHVQDSLLSALFWWIVRALPAAALDRQFLDATGQQVLSVQLLRLFRAHLDSDLSVPEMARQLQMSESSLAHRCTAELGISPRQAYLQCKMERACYLLRHSGMSVQAIGASLGYDDPSTFSRAFRSIHGVPPGRWRRDNC